MAYMNLACMLYIFGYATGISTILFNVCNNNGSFPTVNISCSSYSIIHIESIQYFYKQGPDCSAQTCGQPLTNSGTGLTSTCTGQPSPCLQDIPNDINCTGSTVIYRCVIRENIRDMCEKNFELKQSDRIFLSSSGYPSGNGFTEESCECSIRGSSITSITILDLILKTSYDDVRSNLFIQYGDITYNQTSGDNSQIPFQVYNHRLQTTTPPTTSADVIFSHKQINEQKLWIEIQGTSLTSVCNNISRTPTTPFVPSSDNLRSDTSTHLPSTRTAAPGASVDYISSVPTSKPSTSPTDSGPQQTDNDVVIIVVVSILSLSSVLVLVIVLGLLHRKGKLQCLKQPGNPGAENPRTITQMEPVSNYSNLSDETRNNKDNTYQELQTRNSNSPYTNLPYSSSSEMEAGTNYNSLSDGNKLDTDNHGYQELQTRTPTSPYNNLPYT